MNNKIIITGWIETLPKSKLIDNVLVCEFLLCASSFFNHGTDYHKESFSIPVLAFRKYAKKCIAAGIGKHIEITGSLSWPDNDHNRIYSGFYIDSEKIIIK